MNCRAFASILAWAMATLLLLAADAGAQTAAPAGESPTPPYLRPDSTAADAGNQLDDLTARPWVGDFDGMVQRRAIRVLVTYSTTHYFVDKGTQRGLTYDIFHEFETAINKKLKLRNLRLHVLFIPLARDELIPALLAGCGDVIAANLTITPERQTRVDFADPTFTDISEIVVTGPGADPITTTADLSGREVYVRRSSSYYENLRALNAQLVAARKDSIRVRFASEELETEDILEMVNAGLVKITVVDSHTAAFWSKVFQKIVLVPGAAVHTGAPELPGQHPVRAGGHGTG